MTSSPYKKGEKELYKHFATHKNISGRCSCMNDLNNIVEEILLKCNFKRPGFYHDNYKERIYHAQAIIRKVFAKLGLLEEFNQYYLKYGLSIGRNFKQLDENTSCIEIKCNNEKYVIIFDFSALYQPVTPARLERRIRRISKLASMYKLPKNRLEVFISRRFTSTCKKMYQGKKFESPDKKSRILIWLYELGCYKISDFVKSILLALLEAKHFFIERIKRYIEKIKNKKLFSLTSALRKLSELVTLFSLVMLKPDWLLWMQSLLNMINEKRDFESVLQFLVYS